MIVNTKLMEDFYKELDPLTKDEVYIILGGARKKYAKDNPDISTSHEIVTRQVLRYNVFDFFFQSVRKTSALLKVSVDKNSGKVFPSDSHVIYIGINPRSTILAKAKCDEKMNSYYFELLRDVSEEARKNAYRQIKRFNVHYYSALQKSPSNKKWRILDIDVKDFNIVEDLIVIIDKSNIKFITETHGGYHIIYDRIANEFLLGGKELERIREKYNLKKGDIDVFKDRLTPVWGTSQGGLMVKPYWSRQK